MPKLNYFDSLEGLSLLSSRAVFLSATSGGTDEIISIRENADTILCEIEYALFSDFLPPLERSGIALAAHSMGRIIERSHEIIMYKNTKGLNFEKKSIEAELCIRLMEIIEKNIFRLRRVKKPNELPNFTEFRSLLTEARAAHAEMQKRLSSHSATKAVANLVTLYAELRHELSFAFDEITEIMLQNI